MSTAVMISAEPCRSWKLFNVDSRVVDVICYDWIERSLNKVDQTIIIIDESN